MAHIVSYLKNVNMPLSHNLLVLHYLQQSRVIDAIQLESRSSPSVVSLLCFAAATTLFCENYSKFASTAVMALTSCAFAADNVQMIEKLLFSKEDKLIFRRSI